ncbi:MAG: hypothetical protein AB1773_11770 [Pseudomonadota bacterium]
MLVAGGCAAPQPPREALRFALLGDVPYSQPQANLLDAEIERMNTETLAFVAHVGDITSGRGPCTDEWLEARARQFARLRHPFVLLPGDNDWTDCHRTGFDPLERLAKWRSLFCVPVPLASFARQPGKYCEHVRWEAGGAVFVGLNVPGSHNNLGRDPLETGERMQAVLAWLGEAEAIARNRAFLVILMQANPFVRPRAGGDGYEVLRARLARLAETMPGRVALVHGDTHRFKDDEPLPGLRRIEVWGSPHIRWLRATLSGERLVVEQTPDQL